MGSQVPWAEKRKEEEEAASSSLSNFTGVEAVGMGGRGGVRLGLDWRRRRRRRAGGRAGKKDGQCERRWW